MVGFFILASTGINKQCINRDAPHVTKATDAQRGLVTHTFGRGLENMDLPLYRFLNLEYFDNSGVMVNIKTASG